MGAGLHGILAAAVDAGQHVVGKAWSRNKRNLINNRRFHIKTLGSMRKRT